MPRNIAARRRKDNPDRSLLTVYDGQRCLGYVLKRGPAGVEAFDVNDQSLGVFRDVPAAKNAITTTLDSTASA
jgi:hypothetical protein